jgi:type IV fimbrial biogenesis protein FimT
MRQTGQKGFSLVEVLIVIGILVILAGIAIPQMRGIIENYRLNGAARLVWSDMQNAKMTAVRENRSIRVVFTNPAPGVTDRFTSYDFKRVVGATEERIFTRNLANDYPGVTIRSSGGSTTFNSRGTVDSTTITISLAGRTRSFTIAWTGRIGKIS